MGSQYRCPNPLMERLRLIFSYRHRHLARLKRLPTLQRVLVKKLNHSRRKKT